MDKKRKSRDGDEPLRVPPKWVQDFIRGNRVYGLHFIMEKTINKTDLDKQQNRLLIPVDFVESNILPMINEDEKLAANLSTVPFKKSKTSTDEDKIEDNIKMKKKNVGADHEGLSVMIYDHAGWRFPSVLVRRDTKSTVLRGKEWFLFAQWSGLQVNDQVKMWGLRRKEDGSLCFVLTKKI